MTSNRWLFKALLVIGLLLAAGVMLGCQSAAYQQGDETSQGLTASYSEPAQPPLVVLAREDGSVSVVATGDIPEGPNAARVTKVIVLPGTPGKLSSYRFSPGVNRGDSVIHSRGATWAGASPGETVRDVATQKHKTIQNPVPEITVDARGVHALAGGGASDDAVGLPWHTRAWNWIVSVWRSLSMTVLFLIVLPVLVLFLLPLIFPAAAPICQAVLHGIGHILTFGISSVVSLWRKLKAANNGSGS